jgi:hypothetical protein
MRGPIPCLSAGGLIESPVVFDAVALRRYGTVLEEQVRFRAGFEGHVLPMHQVRLADFLEQYVFYLSLCVQLCVQALSSASPLYPHCCIGKPVTALFGRLLGAVRAPPPPPPLSCPACCQECHSLSHHGMVSLYGRRIEGGGGQHQQPEEFVNQTDDFPSL